MKIIFISIGILMISICVNAQSFSADFERAKQIKFFESNSKAVEDILGKSSFHSFNYDGFDVFYTNFSVIGIEYATGKCSNEDEDWNIEKGKVTSISITPKDDIDISSLAINYSGFRREKVWGISSIRHFYHSKAKGFVLIIAGRIVQGIFLMPPRDKYANLCDKKEVKKYYFGKRFNRGSWKKEAEFHKDYPPKVNEVKLSQTEIFADCSSFELNEKKKCLDNKKISVNALATDPEGEVLTYQYKISGGKVIGQGANVVWDLSDVEAGSYTVTVLVDDGCGSHCGKWMTKTIFVK